jgi:hypothetical protein
MSEFVEDLEDFDFELDFYWWSWDATDWATWIFIVVGVIFILRFLWYVLWMCIPC